MEYRSALGGSELVSWRFGPRQALLALVVSLSIYGLGLAGGLLLARIEVSDAICLAIVHLAGVLGLLAFWRLGRWGRARFDSFGAALILVAVAFRLHATIDTLLYGTRVERIYVYPNLVIPSDVFLLFLKGEVITIIGILLVSCAWRLQVGGAIEKYSILLQSRTVPVRISVFVYLLSLGVDISRRAFGLEFGPLTQIMSLLFVFGVASIYFSAAQLTSRLWQVLIASGMGLPMSFLALNSGMKEEIFFPMIPAALLFWTIYRSLLVRGFAVGLAFTALGMSQTYVHYVRDITWRSDGDINMSPVELITGFAESIGTIDVRDAFDSMSSRVNLTVAHAVTVTLADHNGLEPENVFGMIPASLVPRVFWPSKPVLQPGAMHTARILGIDTPLAEIRSATAAGFATELYLGGWWIGVVLGALIFGYMLAQAQGWALRVTPGYGHLSFCFIAAYWVLRFDEKSVVYAYTSIVFSVIFLWLLTKSAEAFGLKSYSKPPLDARGAL